MSEILLLKVILAIFRIRIFSSGKRKERDSFLTYTPLNPYHNQIDYSIPDPNLTEKDYQLKAEYYSAIYKKNIIVCPTCGGKGKILSNEYGYDAFFPCTKCKSDGLIWPKPGQE